MLVIFAIKFLLFGGAFVIQSCQNDDIHKDSEKQSAIDKFEKIVLDLTPRIEELVDYKNDHSKVIEKYEAKEAMLPLVKGTIELLKSYEIKNADITNNFSNAEDPRIALVGLAILESQSKQQNTIASFSFDNFFIESAYAQGDLGHCAGRAVGIHAFSEIMAGRVGRSAVLGAFRKLASRTLGWIGLGLAVYDFGDCMGYW